ncbi:dTDP-4-keto-6-deoxy-D-glucose epimerase, partial [Candidatus Parvarchaeota archaeon]|nr:dTDP-4-keto-6-deoxy-D-glucose epimerase [Candidatus Parvarchaeota archaeon]
MVFAKQGANRKKQGFKGLVGKRLKQDYERGCTDRNDTMGKIEIEPLGLVGAKLLRAFAAQDERGDFTKIFDNQVLGSLGFEAKEVFLSTNRLGVIRGLHYQNPNPQAKVVFCTRGQVWDVIADLRKSST